MSTKRGDYPHRGSSKESSTDLKAKTLAWLRELELSQRENISDGSSSEFKYQCVKDACAITLRDTRSKTIKYPAIPDYQDEGWGIYLYTMLQGITRDGEFFAVVIQRERADHQDDHVKFSNTIKHEDYDVLQKIMLEDEIISEYAHLNNLTT